MEEKKTEAEAEAKEEKKPATASETETSEDQKPERSVVESETYRSIARLLFGRFIEIRYD